MTREKQRKGLRVLCYLAFGVYLAALCYFLFFAELTGRTDMNRDYHYNLILFKEITRFIKYRHVLGWFPVFANIFGNVLIFVPFGMLVPALSRRYKRLPGVTLLSFELSLAVELIQLITKVGSCDVDDMLLNTLGGILGFACYKIVSCTSRRKHK